MKAPVSIILSLLCQTIIANSENLAIGNGLAAEKEFPHAALIGFENSKDDSDYLCSGILISKRHILTVANCVYDREFKKAKFVKLGDVKRNEPNANTYTYEIIERMKHPNFTSKSIDHNIALFKLDKDVEFNDYVKPACLPNDNEEPKLAFVAGWGQTEFGGDLSKNLKKISMEIFDQEECQIVYTDAKTRNGIDYETKICYGSHTTSGIDTCGGDIGSGLLSIPSTNNTCSWNLVGITTYGLSVCGIIGIPGIYTRVWPYKEWIEENIAAA